MVDYTNRDYITSLSATDTTDGVKDGTDHIHSGIIKVLAQASRGNYVVSYGSSNFQQVAGTGRTKFQFSGSIKFMRDGRLYSSNPTAEELKSDPDGTNDRYDLLVINSSNALEFREGTAASTPRVPDNLISGDIPVALVKVEGGTGVNVTTREVQLYGYDKTAFSESVDKIYNTAGTEIVYLNGTDVTLWGSSAVGAFTLERGESSKEILTVKNTGSEKGAVIEGTGGTASNKVLEIKYGGSSKGGITGEGNLELQGLTASRAVVTNASKELESSDVTSTELGYLDGVTSAIQTQLDSKCSLTGSTNNQVTTVTGSQAITGEANLTFDGNTLTSNDVKVNKRYMAVGVETVLLDPLAGTPITGDTHTVFLYEDASAGNLAELPDPNAYTWTILRVVNMSTVTAVLTAAGGNQIYNGSRAAPTFDLAADAMITLLAVSDDVNIPADGAQLAIVGPAWFILDGHF